eukprot:01269.XXX_2655_2108_1 [CDS] Oithona nana genome sequencing.
MKTIVVFACLLVTVMAYYDNTVSTGFNNFGTTCFPDRCLACKNHFGNSASTFDCEGQCGLCALCPAATTSNVFGCKYCAAGIEACIDTCKKGKQICASCAASCN